MAVVKFNAPSEFLTELEKDKPLIERGLVRLTNLFRTHTSVASLQHWSVVATAKIGSDLVRLEYHCGSLWRLGGPADPAGQQVRETAARIHTEIAEACQRLGLEVRAGMLEESERG